MKKKAFKVRPDWARWLKTWNFWVRVSCLLFMLGLTGLYVFWTPSNHSFSNYMLHVTIGWMIVIPVIFGFQKEVPIKVVGMLTETQKRHFLEQGSRSYELVRFVEK